jgi:hypothetical protein
VIAIAGALMVGGGDKRQRLVSLRVFNDSIAVSASKRSLMPLQG